MDETQRRFRAEDRAAAAARDHIQARIRMLMAEVESGQSVTLPETTWTAGAPSAPDPELAPDAAQYIYEVFESPNRSLVPMLQLPLLAAGFAIREIPRDPYVADWCITRVGRANSQMIQGGA